MCRPVLAECLIFSTLKGFCVGHVEGHAFFRLFLLYTYMRPDKRFR
jgi:hypothetical protein